MSSVAKEEHNAFVCSLGKVGETQLQRNLIGGKVKIIRNALIVYFLLDCLRKDFAKMLDILGAIGL